ncbi:unnamed protein product [Blepharisma stoltei]|uniref:Uncharacterized protein n=1 Tax=Blepharisma stoltei TaxID=1481888 RepID=A0AAU9IST5_9CILI|nr:unnamed protein product [Blepharisma stoltei]
MSWNPWRRKYGNWRKNEVRLKGATKMKAKVGVARRSRKKTACLREICCIWKDWSRLRTEQAKWEGA